MFPRCGGDGEVTEMTLVVEREIGDEELLDVDRVVEKEAWGLNIDA